MNAAAADGHLPGAIAHLHDAIRTLIEPETRYLNNQLQTGTSLYLQLFDATPGEHISGRRELSATAVTWIDALRLRMEIDLAIEIAQPAYRGVPPTIGRLREIRRRTWRPQDVHYIQQMTHAIGEWCKEIAAMLDPHPEWTLPDPCPACNQTVVYRHKDGERVRQHALQISPHGCSCLACHAEWPFPAKFVFLAKLLDRPLPAGVLE